MFAAKLVRTAGRPDTRDVSTASPGHSARCAHPPAASQHGVIIQNVPGRPEDMCSRPRWPIGKSSSLRHCAITGQVANCLRAASSPRTRTGSTKIRHKGQHEDHSKRRPKNIPSSQALQGVESAMVYSRKLFVLRTVIRVYCGCNPRGIGSCLPGFSVTRFPSS